MLSIDVSHAASFLPLPYEEALRPRLARAAHRLKTLRREIRDYYFRYLVTPDTLELRNLAVCAELIVKSAQKRHESRGLHYTLDYPRMSKKPKQTVLPGFHG